MKRHAIVIIVSFLTIVYVVCFVPAITVFSFTETRAIHPRTVYINVTKEKSFQIRFTHSIHLTDVLETYQITNDNKIKFISMEYEDVAVGMPAYPDANQSLYYKNGKYIMSYDNKIINNFTLYIGDIDKDLYFYYDGKTYNLKKELKRGSSYLVEVQKISLFDRLKGAEMKHENERKST